jgi:phosphatidate cytidylyltransferase
MLKKMSDLNQRLIISGLSVLFLLTVIYLSPYLYFRPFFVLACAAIIGSALWEFYSIGKAKGYAPLVKLGIVGTVVYVIADFLSTQSPRLELLPALVVGGITVSSFLYYFIKGSNPFINLSITLFGILYLTIPLSSVININYFFPSEASQDGRWWLFYLLAVTKITDTGAFFCGKNFGKSKLVPYISPRKTWEGAIGGLVFGVATSLVLNWIAQTSFNTPPIVLTFWQSIYLGILISVVGQFGDLAESLLKRDGGVKDSNQLPGLGGMLDVVDSLIFTAPLLYVFLKLSF